MQLVSKGEPSVARVGVRLVGGNTDQGRVGPAYGDAVSFFTDDLGRFRFVDLSPGTYTLWIHPRGAPRLRQKVVVVKGVHLTRLTIELRTGEPRTVINLDKERRRPPVRAEVVSTVDAHLVVSAGSRDGVKAGDELRILRDEKEIARVRVVQVLDDKSLCEVLGAPEEAVKPGDAAVR